MNNNANQCPRCKKFIFGTYCYACKEDINKMKENLNFFDDLVNPFKDIFEKNE